MARDGHATSARDGHATPAYPPPPMTWMHKIRRRALWIAVGVGITTLGVLSITTVPAWPIVGVAVATLALAINQLTSRLSQTICLGCGQDLSGQPLGEHRAPSAPSAGPSRNGWASTTPTTPATPTSPSITTARRKALARLCSARAQ